MKTILYCNLLLVLVGFILTSHADINRVRVLNQTDSPVYIHRGGFSASVKLEPKTWQIFYYPFYLIPPGSSKKVAVTNLVASSGGKWVTTPNGVTFLSNPKLLICLDYKSPENTTKTGDRLWVIQKAEGVDPNCKVFPYKQPWYQNN